jgi:hypothetical protein
MGFKGRVGSMADMACVRNERMRFSNPTTTSIFRKSEQTAIKTDDLPHRPEWPPETRLRSSPTGPPEIYVPAEAQPDLPESPVDATLSRQPQRGTHLYAVAYSTDLIGSFGAGSKPTKSVVSFA